MGASVQPVQVPSDGDRITRNIAAMRAQGASEHDVETYLTQHEGLQPTQDTGLSMRNLGRSLVQGATLGWGDEMGLTSRSGEQAFQGQHPIADFIAKMTGGIAAPAAAVMAAPALGASLGGAALLGAGTGAIAGAGEANSGNRLTGALQGGLLGAAGGVGGYGLAKGAGAVAGSLLDRSHPERAVSRAAASLLSPEVSAKLAQVDAIAPGGASLATAAAPSEGDKASRFLPMLRAVAANPSAGASAEASITAQKGALAVARKGLGAQMDALGGNIPVTPEGHAILDQAKEILGSKAPNVASDAETMNVQDARDALARLRFAERQAVKQGTAANGPNLHDIAVARAGLQSYIYDHAPGFAELDRPYAMVMDQIGQANTALKTVQRSRANYAANEAYGATSGSLGGSLPRGAHGVVMTALDKILTNRAGAADAVSRLIAKPGGPELVNQILAGIPQTTGTAPQRAALLGIGAMRGLLSPQNQSP